MPRRRVRHIVAGTFWGPVEGGGTRPAFPRLANARYPPSANSPGDALLRGTWSLSGDLGSNVFHEFWPDVKRKLKKLLGGGG